MAKVPKLMELSPYLFDPIPSATHHTRMTIATELSTTVKVFKEKPQYRNCGGVNPFLFVCAVLLPVNAGTVVIMPVPVRLYSIAGKQYVKRCE